MDGRCEATQPINHDAHRCCRRGHHGAAAVGQGRGELEGRELLAVCIWGAGRGGDMPVCWLHTSMDEWIRSLIGRPFSRSTSRRHEGGMILHFYSPRRLQTHRNGGRDQGRGRRGAPVVGGLALRGGLERGDKGFGEDARLAPQLCLCRCGFV